uniref:Uncharacterized protein isoform X1 n=1 Tax=Nicotiana tabacum TaxID=4097 RepID=A0A1S4B9Z3_TOBAC|nr:PREDICTED: uncharacterized protein LOC107806070 isoform X1 [Nicotiana tabacum]
MIPQQWAPPCNNQCTHKYAALMQIPWRVFCKKGCDADGESWDECLSECEEICYKNPVLKDQQWSAYIDRSPGAASCSELFECAQRGLWRKMTEFLSKEERNCSIIIGIPFGTEECFHACVAGCGYKFDVPSQKVDQIHPSKPLKPPPKEKPAMPAVKRIPPLESSQLIDDVPGTSA